MNKLTPIIILLLAMAGCVTTQAVRKGFDFGGYARIGVAEFVPYGFYPESGSSVSDEFIRLLIKAGKKVIDIDRPYSENMKSYEQIAGKYGVDGIIAGTVTRYIPDGKETVYFENQDGEVVSKVFFREAEVGVSARFIDLKTGEVLWSDSYTYDGFDIENTISAVVEILVGRLRSAGK